MATSREKFAGTGQWKGVEILTKANSDEWFETVETVAQSEDVAYLLTKSESEHCHTTIPKASEQGYDLSDGTWKVMGEHDKDEDDKLLYESKDLLRSFRIETAKFKLNLLRKCGYMCGNKGRNKGIRQP